MYFSAAIDQADHNAHHDPLRRVHDALQRGKPPTDVEVHVVVEHEASELKDGEDDSELDARPDAGARGVHPREDRGGGAYREEYAEHPEQAEALKCDPSLVKSAVEELLRYTSPVEMATERYAREDVEIEGATIPRGELVLAVLGSANRDERRFEDPDALDLARDPNRHLAFGRGAARPDGRADRHKRATAALPGGAPAGGA